ncbi:alpha/beta fold hydrolase [Sphingomonas jaspsi]|uniref:alpha/beta fold hydrolase n=1 Tax=Sphingomonas jaspsi TaxID=392409 RepID=UPI0004B153AF|nr:alpha/beta hydrolase [Sphingomonas jaspsi]
MKIWTLVTAAAASSLLAPAACSPVAAQPLAAAQAATTEHDHIRTRLYGTKGPVIVLIPGMSTPGAVWDETVAALRTDHRLLVVEVKGFEGVPTPANEGPGLIDGIVADLAADLTSRRIGKAIVAGHSFGGLLAMKFALDRPDQVKGIMVVDALPFFGTVLDDKATVESVTPQANMMKTQMLANREAMKAAAVRGVSKDPGGGMAATPEARMKIANWALKADPAVVAQAVYEDLMTDLRGDIAAIEVPMVVLYQAQDPEKAQHRYVTDYAAQPAARLVPVANTAHFIMIDRPDLFQAELNALAR